MTGSCAYGDFKISDEVHHSSALSVIRVGPRHRVGRRAHRALSARISNTAMEENVQSTFHQVMAVSYEARILGQTGRSIAVGVLVLALGGCGDARKRPPIQAAYDQTGKLRLLTYDSNGNGKPDMWSYMDGGRIVRIEIDKDEDGVIDRWEYYDANQKLEKVGTSRANDGKVDTWAFPPDGNTVRVELSTKRDGRVTRTEFYEGGVLVRAQEDTDGNGSLDKWETYANGVLTSVAFDTEGAGRPTRRLVYDEKGNVRIETGRDLAAVASKR
jgi:hypothetical protein